ncbi:aspartate aminotransferase family protein [Peribacillus cavernae]|uniref:Aspartate aminotransferase family protein n=1 Tax=Peribacillus cavernae TaxID=1674310 RepID=A0A3S0VQG4_9BACI|nr:aspartate aminotransferase family protein [Peribacillus cavernae]MDQ0217958.1 adenosylmethionine-8-amino-7-oxononanoate aminotransferase [Peribacillus cavernae]RUQ32604.1 aspartate aminotransferase family protein [Peribacillus cavernae]
MKHSSLIKPVLDGEYPMISHGKGVYLYDTDEKEYLDAASGAVTANIGHGVEEIATAMVEQAKQVSFVYRSQFTSEAAEALASKIAAMTDDRYTWSFFVNSGSEATETALKIAIQHWQEKGKPKKNRIISRWMSYHGITLGALSMSGHPLRRERFTAILESYPAVSPPYCYRCPYNLEETSCGLACAADLESAIRRIGPDNVAAFIAEPVIGAAGAAIAPPDGYFPEIKRICEKYEVLFIADEVMTGFGRTGKMLACDHWGVEPDIITFGKGMSGGYTPIAAAVMTDKVIEPILNGSKSIMGGHTFSANPQSCAVSLAVLEYLEKNGIFEKAATAGVYLRNLLDKLASRYSFIGDVRGKGLLIGIEFVKDQKAKEPFPAGIDITNKIIGLAADNGLLLYPAAAGLDGVTGAAIIISPPLSINKREIEELIRRLKNTFSQFAETLLSEPMTP